MAYVCSYSAMFYSLFSYLSLAGSKAFVGHGRLSDTQNLYVDATPVNDTFTSIGSNVH